MFNKPAAWRGGLPYNSSNNKVMVFIIRGMYTGHTPKHKISLGEKYTTSNSLGCTHMFPSLHWTDCLNKFSK